MGKFEIVALPLVRRSIFARLPQKSNQIGFFVRHWSQKDSAAGSSLLRQRMDQLIDKAANKWESYSMASEKSISGRIYSAGNRLMDRIDADEWFLKEIPSAPDGTSAVKLIYPATDSANAVNTSNKVPLLEPGEIHQRLQQLIIHRLQYHNQYRTRSIACLPLSMLMGIIPCPNVFLAYNLFRVYSHDKAFKGAERLHKALALGGGNELLLTGTIEMVPSRQLDDLISTDDQQSKRGTTELSELTMERIAEKMEMPRYFLHDIRRATKQAAAAVQQQQHP